MRLIILLGVLLFSSPVAAQYEVCAIGDSQVEPGSAFIRYLQRELGPEYHITPHGRRSWTTDRWIRAGDFGTLCADSDIVLVSLGGNDIPAGHDFAHIRTNVRTLMDSIPWGRVRVLYHMIIPRFYYPLPTMARDGIHLSRTGAREYARIVAPYLRMSSELEEDPID